MATITNKLKPMFVANVTKPGMYADGGGLYLQVTGPNAKSWLYRYEVNGRERKMGLGPLAEVSLANARKKAAERRQERAAGIDPLEAQKEKDIAQRLAAANTITFRETAKQYIEIRRASWSSRKTILQWETSLESYVYPAIGSLPVSEIDTPAILKILQPLWTTKFDTANKVRGRIENVLDWAKAHNFRSGENPARLRGHLKFLLVGERPPRKHHAALPVANVGPFMTALRTHDGIGARCLEFLILTAARTTEALCAQWSEIDHDARTWTVPAARMKARREHIVPLSDAAMNVLAIMRAYKFPGDLVFPSLRSMMPLSNMALAKQLERMNYGEITVHGFRSTFSDWAGDYTNFDSRVIEFALAHGISDKTEAAYRRATAIDKRRRLMELWADHCATSVATDANVVPMRAAAQLH